MSSDIAAGRYCGFDGSFGSGVTMINGSGFGVLGTLNIDEYFVEVIGADFASSTYIVLYAPRGSRIFSPLTSLVRFSGDQAAVKRALGLDNGVFSLVQDRELTTFDHVAALASADDGTRAEAERILAANLRVVAVAFALSGTTAEYQPLRPTYDRLGAFIGSNSGFIFQNATMSRYLAGILGSNYDPQVISAIAHLIDAYAATIGVRVADEATARQFMLGIHGYLVPEIRRLLISNSVTDASTVARVTTQDILNQIRIFRNGYSLPATGRFFPAPNFAETSGGAITLQADGNAPTSGGSLVTNDLFAQGIGEGATGLGGGDAEVTGVTIPAEFASAITVNLVGLTSKTVTVATLGGFRGRAFFDYAVRHPSGATGTARVYVNFR